MERRRSVFFPIVFTILLAHHDVQSDERLPMKFSKLVQTISKKPIPSYTKHLIVEVMVMDEEGEDVEVPFIVVRL